MAYDAVKYKQEERDVYDRIAPKWNDHMADITAPFSWRLLDVLLPVLNSRLLDVACGTGHLARQAVGHFGCSVDAIDLSEGMLAEARRRSDGVTGITYNQGDAERLEFTDNSFDCAASSFGLMYFPDARRALAEIRRVLRPGGRAGLAVWADAYATPALRVLVASMAEVLAAPPVRRLLRTGWIGERILVAATENEIPGSGPSPFRFGRPGKLENLLKEAQFTDVQVFEHHHVWRFPTFGQMWTHFVQSTPYHARPDDAQFEEIARILRRKSARYKADEGYAFPMKAILVTGVKPA